MLTLTNAVSSNSSVSVNSEQSRLTSSYEPSMATTSPSYTAVVRILPGSRSAGMKTIDGTPARAECAATELARLPVEAQANRVNPKPFAAGRATDTPPALNESVGFAQASLTHHGGVEPRPA